MPARYTPLNSRSVARYSARASEPPNNSESGFASTARAYICQLECRLGVTPPPARPYRPPMASPPAPKSRQKRVSAFALVIVLAASGLQVFAPLS